MRKKTRLMTVKQSSKTIKFKSFLRNLAKKCDK